MAERQESIADIIAWLRRPREGENAYLTVWRDEITDHLEAAWKRERGNCAKLREALETMNNLFERGVICTSYANSAEEMEQIEELYRKTKSALAAPPRNCDRFATLPDALAAWRDIDPREAGPFDLWLFDTAKEGGAK